MTACNHSKLIQLLEEKNRLRCRHCHLTIKADELGENYCPECFEVHGKKRYNFEEIAAADAIKPQFKCEECGIMIL